MDCKSRDSKKKLEYILGLQAQGLDPEAIANNMGYSRLKNLNEFMSKQGYKKKDNRYIRQMEDNSPIDEIAITVEDSCPIDVVQEDTCPTVSIQNQQQLIDIIDNHIKIMDIIKWFDNREDTCPTQVIEVVTGLQINYNKSKAIKTTVRVDDDVWNTFSDICKDKYSQFSKVDILSQLIHEFNEKHR